MATHDTSMMGVKSADQRSNAMTAEFYPTHTMLPNMWYFLEAMNQTQDPDERDDLDVSPYDQARATVPFFASPDLGIDAWGMQGLD